MKSNLKKILASVIPGIFLLICSGNQAQGQMIAIVAGNGYAHGGAGAYNQAVDGGAATASRLNEPGAVLVDPLGNIYISDFLNNRIRKVSAATGIITTIAGKGSLEYPNAPGGYGGDGGLASSDTCKLSDPGGMAMDTSGNLYIADWYNARIRKISANTGIITTVAGYGVPGYGGDGYSALTATLGGPRTLALDAARNIYIADEENNRIRKVDAATGIITTVAGNGHNGHGGDGGPADSATIHLPWGVALDTSGNIYFTEQANHCIRKVTVSTGIINTIIGTGVAGYSGDGGPADSAEINNPLGITVDASGNIYFADAGNNRIRKVYASTGIITTLAGNGIRGFGNGANGIPADSEYLALPCNVGLDASGNLYIADGDNHLIRKVFIHGSCYPTINIRANTADTVCTGTSVTFNAAITNAGPAPAYQWQVNGVNAGTNSSSFTAVVINDSDVITCKLTGTAGCDSGIIVHSNLLTMTVKPVLIPTIAVRADSTICTGTTPTFHAIVTNAGNTPSYQWKLNGINIGIDSNAVTYPGFTTGDTIACVLTSSLGCANPVTATSGNFTKPVPVAITSVTPHNVSCFGGNNGSACVSVSGNVPPYNYTWSPYVSFQSCSQIPLTAGTYYVTVTDIYGCTASVSISITQPSPLQLDSVTVTDATCYTNGGTLCIYASGGTGSYQYHWSDGGLGSWHCYNPQPSATPYVTTVTDAHGCSVTASAIVGGPGRLIDSVEVTNAGCSSNNGTIQIFTSTAGILPYKFTIDYFNTFQSSGLFSNLSTGFYPIWVIDSTGCQDSVNIQVNQATTLHVDSNIITSVSCFGGSNGSACVYVSGGTPTYTYLWSNGTISQCISNLLPAIYWVTITDVNGCSTVDSITITQPTALHIDSNIVHSISCFGAGNGSACPYVSGGTPGYIYHWSNNQTFPCINQLVFPAIYVVTITDANGCSVLLNDTITEPPLLTCTITALSDTIHYGQIDSLTVNVTGGVPTHSYAWNTGDTRNPMPISMCGNYIITVTDQNGCSASASDSGVICLDDYVWPGDANYDGIADNNDLLAIGLAYGATGSVRPNASLVWIGQPSPDWILMDTLPNGVNYKNIDCDGNGVINADDTLAIIQNWGLTHIRGGGMDEWRSGVPALVVKLVPDTAYAGDTVIAELILGDSSIMANNVYGLAFTLNYDPIVVDTTKTVTSFGNSWLGNSTDKISIDKDFKHIGKIQCAITRIDHTTRSGGGQIGSTAFVITTDNINGKDYSFYAMRVYISDVTMIDNAGNILQVNAGMDTTSIGYFPTGIAKVAGENNLIQIFPNPANNHLLVTSQIAAIEIKITDVLGKEIIRYTPANLHYSQLDVSQLSNGIYFVTVMTGKGVSTQRVVIER